MDGATDDTDGATDDTDDTDGTEGATDDTDGATDYTDDKDGATDARRWVIRRCRRKCCLDWGRRYRSLF